MPPRHRLGIAALALAAVLSAQTSRVRAQDAYACLDDLSEDEVRHRLRFIEDHLEEHGQYSRLWWWGWLTVIGGAGLGYWSAFAFAKKGDDPHDYRMRRERLFINATGATLLTTQLSVFAMTSAHAERKLRRMPMETPAQRRAKLARATALLERAAARQELGLSPTAHFGGPLWGIGTGTYLAVRDHPTFFVASAFLMPLVISEARILTQPRAAIAAWRKYRAMACYGRSGYAIPRTPTTKRVDWDVGLGPGGLQLGMRF